MHAYMIIAHNQFELLEKLIKRLDDERNDIYIHIDAKVKDFDFERFENITKFSKVRFTPKRINIAWGDSSQVSCEMLLLKTAVEHENQNNPYTYYHLISGVDLPIKSNDEIHEFFDKNQGKEFIHYSDNEVSDVSVARVRYYHFFRKRRNLVTKVFSQAALRIQIMVGVNRLKNKKIKIQKGCNWFSITSDFAHYIVENYKKFEKVFRYSYCGDELLVQTFVENSKFKNNLFMPNCSNNHFACARLIDWERGNPYIWRKEDFDIIKSSPCMFARKFDLNVDREIIDLVLNQL